MALCCMKHAMMYPDARKNRLTARHWERIKAKEEAFKALPRPAKIIVKTIELGTRDPKWNYMTIHDTVSNETSLVPCCLKESPCWECR